MNTKPNSPSITLESDLCYLWVTEAVGGGEEISEENSCQNASDIQKIGALGVGVMGDRCSHFVKSKTVSPK